MVDPPNLVDSPAPALLPLAVVPADRVLQHGGADPLRHDLAQRETEARSDAAAERMATLDAEVIHQRKLIGSVSVPSRRAIRHAPSDWQETHAGSEARMSGNVDPGFLDIQCDDAEWRRDAPA